MVRLTASPFAAPALAALALAGCTVGPDYRAKTPAELGVPTAYSVPAPASPEDLTRWWSNFDDPVLGQLVEQARGANTDIAQAIGRLRQAREALVQSRASLLPTLSGSAGYQRNENLRGGGRSFTLPDGTVVDTGGGGTNSFSAGLSASYQVGCSARSAGRWRRAARNMKRAGSTMRPCC